MAAFFKNVTEGTTIELYIRMLNHLKSQPITEEDKVSATSLINSFKELRKYSDTADLISKVQWRPESSASYPKKEELEKKREHRKNFGTAQDEFGSLLDKVLGKEKADVVFNATHKAKREYGGDKQKLIKTVMTALETQFTQQLQP